MVPSGVVLSWTAFLIFCFADAALFAFAYPNTVMVLPLAIAPTIGGVVSLAYVLVETALDCPDEED